MSSAQAKLFEWHRLAIDIQRIELELREVSKWADPYFQRRAQELLDELELLRTRSSELLSEVDRLRL